MKQLFWAMALFLSPTAYGQATLEHTYTEVGGVQLFKLEGEGDKYMMWDTVSKSNKLYNLDHSLWKEVKFTAPAGWSGGGAGLATTKLFNLDNKVEVQILLYRYDNVTSKSYYSTYILNEDGAVVNKFDDVIGVYPYKTSAGWKLITTGWGTSQTQIYSLPGSMPQPSGFKPESGESGETSIHPNPVETAATISYNLPLGQSQATLTIFNMSGQTMKQMTVTSQFNSILIYRGDLPAGNYIYEVAGQKQQFVVR